MCDLPGSAVRKRGGTAALASRREIVVPVPGLSTGSVLIGVLAIVAWGATATAMPPMLQSAAMRHCPDDPDGASGLYVAAFQVGIMAGSLAGGLLFERAGVPVMLTASGLLVAGALASMLLARDLFATASATSGK